MQQIDFVGAVPVDQQPARQQLRDTKPAVAEEKAVLALRLRALCMKPPKSLGSASAQMTRSWLQAQQ